MSRVKTRPRAPRSSTSSPPADGLRWLLVAVLILATVGAYWSSFNGIFVGDDVEAIVENPHVRSLTPVGEALSAPRDTTAAGRPLVSATLALNYAAGGYDPWGYHAFNLAVHLGAALLLLVTVGRTLRTSVIPARIAARSGDVAFAVALVWALHPLHTAAVTYVIQRAESLMGLCLLLMLYGVIRATDPRGRRTGAWTLVAVVACVLGLTAKETMVVAPFLAAAWVWLFRPADTWKARPTWILLGGLAAAWIVLALLVASGARGESVGFGLGGWSWWSYLRTQSAVIVHYLRLAFVPAPLVFSYAWPPAASWLEVAPQLALLALAAVATAIGVMRRRPLAFLGLWFFLILGPSSSVLPIATEVAAEHRMYLPVAAVVAGVVLMAAVWLPRRVFWVGVVGVSLVFGTMTHARSRDYWSLEALMRDTVENQPGNSKARVVLGGHLLGLERFAEAETHLRAAIANPRHPGEDPGLPALAHMYLGSALAAQGNVREGIEVLERARALNPGLGETHAFLGEAYASQGRFVEAADSFDRAVAALPDVPPLLDRAARLRATSRDAGARDGAIAVRYAERAVQLTGGNNWSVLDTLAAAYAEAGRFDEARATINRAIEAARSQEPRAVALLETRASLYAAHKPLREY